MKKPSAYKAILLLFLTITLTGCSISKAMRVQNHETIEVKTMISELRDTPLVFLGERHDAPAHHELQLEILKAMKAQGKPLAIGMEMFEESSQRALDAWSAGKVPEYAFRKVFEWNWRNIRWGLYRDILLFARDNRIPVVALNAPRDVVQRVAQTGFDSLTAGDLAQLPAGINAEVSDEYMSFITSSYGVHGNNRDAFRNICEAQMLRNRVMARRISDYFKTHPDTTMVVLAGGGHAREKGGVPSELANIRYKIVLPPVPTLTAKTITKYDGDYLLEEPFF